MSRRSQTGTFSTQSVGKRHSHRGTCRRTSFIDHTLGSGQVRLDVGKLEKLAVQLALQGERLAQARLVASQPGFRIGDAAAMLFEIGVHPVEGVLQPGNQSDRRRLAVDADRVGKICPFQRQVRLQPRIMPAGADVAGQVEAADMADRPSALGAFPRGEPDFRQQGCAGSLATA
jgi:hypothetical protein